MDLARAPCRVPLTARKMGSGYENAFRMYKHPKIDSLAAYNSRTGNGLVKNSVLPSAAIILYSNNAFSINIRQTNEHAHTLLNNCLRAGYSYVKQFIPQ